MEPKSNHPSTEPWYRESRWLSASELMLGVFLVIGHNVYRIVPNEVPILLMLGLISLRLRSGGWSALGLNRPSSWGRTILVALGAAALRVLLSAVVIDPLTTQFWPPAAAPSGTESIAGDPAQALKWLGLVWTWAAFGEEISYRGYLLNRAADLGGRSTLAYWVAMVFVSVLFGYGHYYKGPSGIIDSGVAGLIFGSAYLLSKRNLWVAVLAHGFVNTFGLTVVFLGWSS